MSNKPTHTAYIVSDAEGSDKKAQWFEIAKVWTHSGGEGFDLVLPHGVTVSGRLVIRRIKEKAKAD